MKTVTVSADALRSVLEALNGPRHLISELEATRFIDSNNPIEVLIKEYNQAVIKHNKENIDEG